MFVHQTPTVSPQSLWQQQTHNVHTITHTNTQLLSVVYEGRKTEGDSSSCCCPCWENPPICLPAQNGQTQLSIKQLTYLLSDATAALQVDTDGQQFGFTDDVISKTHKCGKVALRDMLTWRSSC